MVKINIIKRQDAYSYSTEGVFYFNVCHFFVAQITENLKLYLNKQLLITIKKPLL